eukprot:TRINITY_DN857_c0_g1_i5.p1 TRINITY_DN857_c0_g1~~TRINITY_DN857_c0_g1_i5.p1  ORF type:complete len:337 (+),score=81.67 TRINITY_DN857_c0_g1_i5:79-1089(+)
MAWYTSLYDLMTLRLYGGAHLAWSEMYMVMAGLAIVWYVLRRVRRRQAARTYAVLVTGASRGLGLAFARRFARLGDQVVITARDDKELQDAKATFPPYSGGKVYAKACDISSEQSVLELCRFIRGTVKTVDIWVNNAAVMEQPPTLFVDADVAQDMQRILNTNVLGTMIACRAALTTMMRQGDGGQIFIVDGAGASGVATPKHAAYGASKAAVAQLAATLSAEAASLAPHVGVHLVSPCTMLYTRMLFGERGGAATAAAASSSSTMLGMLTEDVDDIAAYLVPRIRDTRGNGRRIVYRTRLGTALLMLRAVLASVPLVGALFRRRRSPNAPGVRIK